MITALLRNRLFRNLLLRGGALRDSPLRDKRGVAALEFAIFGGAVLIPVLAGAVDCGLLISSYASVTRAQQAGAMAAWSGAGATAIQSAASTAYGSGSPNIQVTTSWYCAPNASTWTHTGTSYSSQPTCSSGYTATEYASIAVSATVNLPVPLPGFPAAYPIASTAMVRLQ
jgi:Flp pilus assembly protein TadG